MPQIFHYHPVTGEILGSSEYTPPVGVGLPANSTDVEPPLWNEGEIPVFENGTWIIVENNIGKEIYKKSDASKIIVTDLGPLPNDYTELLPPAFSKWDSVTEGWSIDRVKEIIAAIYSLEEQQTARRIREAALGQDGGWLSNLDNQIAQLRIDLSEIEG